MEPNWKSCRFLRDLTRKKKVGLLVGSLDYKYKCPHVF
jgi:hypothetical protein